MLVGEAVPCRSGYRFVALWIHNTLKLNIVIPPQKLGIIRSPDDLLFPVFDLGYDKLNVVIADKNLTPRLDLSTECESIKRGWSGDSIIRRLHTLLFRLHPSQRRRNLRAVIGNNANLGHRLSSPPHDRRVEPIPARQLSGSPHLWHNAAHGLCWSFLGRNGRQLPLDLANRPLWHHTDCLRAPLHLAFWRYDCRHRPLFDRLGHRRLNNRRSGARPARRHRGQDRHFLALPSLGRCDRHNWRGKPLRLAFGRDD
jgi:hypothetical protein